MRHPLTAGRLLYLFYHWPRAEVRKTVREGGWRERLVDHQARSAMTEAAGQLPPPIFPEAQPPLELHMLTGRAFAFQSAFCLWSFAHAAERNLTPVFHDDGTLSPGLIENLQRIFPRARVVASKEAAEKLDDVLPAGRFPFLRDRFFYQPLFRKMISPHLGSHGWKLVLDSDLLFFRRPDFLLQWMHEPDRPLHMSDHADAYGYSRGLLEKLAGGPLPDRVNTGLCGLRSEALDWE